MSRSSLVPGSVATAICGFYNSLSGISSSTIVYLSMCLSVLLYPLNVKTAKLPKNYPREGLWMLKIRKKLSSKYLDFCKSLKIHEQILLNQ